MKKLGILIVFLALCMGCALGASADEMESGDYMYRVEGGGAVITEYEGESTTVNIPATLGGYPVIAIDEYVFEDFEDLRSIQFPNSLTSIGNDAFSRCKSLTSVTFPEGLVHIGDGAFGYCKGLITVTLPKTVMTLGKNPFDRCDALERIDVAPENPVYTSIDGVLFDKREGTLVAFPGAWPGEAYVVPQGTLHIGNLAFAGCRNLTSVTLPEGLLSIETSAFSGCSGLTSVSLPKGLKTIKNGVFRGCDGLTSVTLPEELTTIGSKTFTGFPNLTLTVIEGSYGAQYAKENDIPHQVVGSQQAAVQIPAPEIDPEPAPLPVVPIDLPQQPTSPPALENASGFVYRNGIQFGMSADQVKGQERNAPTTEGWDTFNTPRKYNLAYDNETVQNHPCRITYIFGDGGLEQISVYIYLDMRNPGNFMNVYTEIENALISKYSQPDGPAETEYRTGSSISYTTWSSNAERDFIIQHHVIMVDDGGFIHGINYWHQPANNPINNFDDI